LLAGVVGVVLLIDSGKDLSMREALLPIAIGIVLGLLTALVMVWIATSKMASRLQRPGSASIVVMAGGALLLRSGPPELQVGFVSFGSSFFVFLLPALWSIHRRRRRHGL
jgi:hypothetical protein